MHPTRGSASNARVRSLLCLVVTAALLLEAPAARAADCPAFAGSEAAALDQLDAERRLNYLAVAFDQEVQGLHTWSFAWGSLYAVVGAAQLGVLGWTKDPGTKIDLSIGTASAGFGAVTLFLLPMRLMQPMANARAQWNNPDRCALLAEAERAMVQVARDEAFGKSWLAQSGNVLVNLGLVLISGLGFHRWKEGLISGGIGLVVGETNLWTQPAHMGAKMRAYREGKLTPPAPPSWFLGAAPLTGQYPGMALAMTFIP